MTCHLVLQKVIEFTWSSGGVERKYLRAPYCPSMYSRVRYVTRKLFFGWVKCLTIVHLGLLEGEGKE